MRTRIRFIGGRRMGFLSPLGIWLATLWLAAAQPANDAFIDRITLAGSSISAGGSNLGGTKEPGEPNHAGWSGSASVWWSWVAPSATTARFDTIGSGFDTLLAVYTGTEISNLTSVAYGAQSLSTNSHYASQAGFMATPGVEYLIAVDTEWGDTGSIELNLVTGVPLITNHPQTQGVPQGNNATFSVSAAGEEPLFYQWKKNGTNMANATTASLTLTNLQLADAATYSVIVTNQFGSASSRSAVLSLPIDEPYYFTTIAGKPGTAGTSDGMGNVARFDNPVSVAMDSAGNLFIADIASHTIRKLTPVGTNWLVSTIAGTAGVSGFTDGTNADARFKLPNWVAVDAAGALYVADRGNRALRRIVAVGTNWVVSTIATGFSSPSGCAVDRAGNVYVADVGNGKVQKVSLVGTTWVVTLVASGLASPDRVAVDSSTNLYVSVNAISTICKITPSGASWVVSTIAGYGGPGGRAAVDGTGSDARFDHPEGVAVGDAGSVYIGDYWNNTIRKITPAGLTTTLAGLAGVFGASDGAGSAARFNYPNGVAVDSHGVVYVADEDNHVIRMGRPVVQMQCPPSAWASQITTQGFECTISLASGLNYRVQESSDLTNWADLTNFRPAGPTQSFQDQEATNQPRRFYRVLGP